VSGDLLIKNAEVEGRAGLDLRIRAGRIVEIGVRLSGAEPVHDAAGGAVLPGLVDHHIHLMATAARYATVDLSEADDLEALVAALRNQSGVGWLRGAGCPIADALDRDILDRVEPRRPLRIQDRTGALWVLNSAALTLVEGPDHPGERDATGRLTGRFWRADGWLGERIGRAVPPLDRLARELAGYGLTALTDATVGNDAQTAVLLAEAVPQKLTIMSGGPLSHTPRYAVGPVKIVPDERDPPSLEDFTALIAGARVQKRAVAVHCVSDVEAALTLAAFAMTGARPGDRIEHGGLLDQAMIGEIARLGLTVVTQPAFIHARGDRYRREVPPDRWDDLYRCGSLRRAGVRLAAGSDAPYGPADPWLGIRTARDRLTAGGAILGADERIAARQALDLYLSPPDDPGGPPKRVAVGMAADLCLLDRSQAQQLADPRAESVVGTVIDGALV
jgi:predicted amidohydrolase YtcJ